MKSIVLVLTSLYVSAPAFAADQWLEIGKPSLVSCRAVDTHVELTYIGKTLYRENREGRVIGTDAYLREARDAQSRADRCTQAAFAAEQAHKSIFLDVDFPSSIQVRVDDGFFVHRSESCSPAGAAAAAGESAL